MSIVSLLQDTSGRQTSQDWCSQPSAEQTKAPPPRSSERTAPSSRGSSSSPGPDSQLPEFSPVGATNAKAMAGEAGSAVFVSNFTKQARVHRNTLKSRRCRKRNRQCPGLVGRGGRIGLPASSWQGSPAWACASSRPRWRLRSSPAPDWLTFQCHSRRRSSFSCSWGRG